MQVRGVRDECDYGCYEDWESGREEGRESVWVTAGMIYEKMSYVTVSCVVDVLALVEQTCVVPIPKDDTRARMTGKCLWRGNSVPSVGVNHQEFVSTRVTQRYLHGWKHGIFR